MKNETLPESSEIEPASRPRRGLKALAGAGLAAGVTGAASAQAAAPTVPAEMAPNALVEGGLAALGPIFVPAVTMVATVGLALGIVRFIWSSARKGGRGG